MIKLNDIGNLKARHPEPVGGRAIRMFKAGGNREKVLACVLEKIFLIIGLTR